MAERAAGGDARRLIAWVSIGGVVACAGILTLLALHAHQPSAFDVRLGRGLFGPHESWLEEFTERLVISTGSRKGGLIFVVLAGGWWWIYRRDLRPGILLAAAYTGAAATAILMKPFIGRPPALHAVGIGATFGRAFPSTHVAILGSLCGMVVVIVALSRRRWHPMMLIAIGLAASLMIGTALSLMRMGLHWFTDILAGAAIAGIWVFGLLFPAYEMWTRPGLVARLRRSDQQLPTQSRADTIARGGASSAGDHEAPPPHSTARAPAARDRSSGEESPSRKMD